MLISFKHLGKNAGENLSKLPIVCTLRRIFILRMQLDRSVLKKKDAISYFTFVPLRLILDFLGSATIHDTPSSNMGCRSFLRGGILMSFLENVDVFANNLIILREAITRFATSAVNKEARVLSIERYDRKGRLMFSTECADISVFLVL